MSGPRKEPGTALSRPGEGAETGRAGPELAQGRPRNGVDRARGWKRRGHEKAKGWP
jgi:hypothetical protein